MGITIIVEYIYEWISYWESNWKLIEKAKAAKEDEVLIDLEEKNKKFKAKLQKLKVELAEKRLERANKLLIMSTDNKDPKEIAKYEKIIAGTKGQLADAQAGKNLTKPDKDIVVKEEELERVDETETVNWANLFGETDADGEDEENKDREEMDDEEKEEKEEEDEMEKEEEEEEEGEDEEKMRKIRT